MAWRAMDPLTAVSDDSSSTSDSEEDDDEAEQAVKKEVKEKSVVATARASQKLAMEKKGGKDGKKVELDYDALSRHGYSGGPSVLYVPPPKQDLADPNWSWSNGKRKSDGQQEAESLDERELTQELANERPMKMAADALAESAFAKKQKRDAIAEQKALSFSQKEKRKRDFGQASRGKNYVEEEKRLLRDAGVYSGFDT